MNFSLYIQNITKQMSQEKPFSIENGYFIFTLMPSLRCSLNCPHCYLSLEQRRKSPIMDLKDLKIAAEKVDSYYQERDIKEKVIKLAIRLSGVSTYLTGEEE